MNILTLGCSGGIGGHIGGHVSRTTSFLVDEDILIDCGTGVGDLPLDTLKGIDHVFLTHAHFDHIACLPMLMDSIADRREGAPLTVYARAATLRDLRTHIFNWRIWPDFSAIPDRQNALLRFSPVRVGQTITLQGRRFTPLPARHTVPALGYLMDAGGESLAFSGDSTHCPSFWRALNAQPRLAVLIIETAFSNRDKALAQRSCHMCPDILAASLRALRSRPQLLITHLKPSQADTIMAELSTALSDDHPRLLFNGQTFRL
jgi:ribonuclease BN (tRNA processing enzyme)